MNDDIKSIERLLEEARVILEDRDEKIAKGAGFNVFRLCGVNHYEVWHSKILAEFLNPQGSHGQGACFLACFQKLLEDNYGFNGVFSDKTILQTEVTGYTGDDSVGRMDILIEDKSEKSVCIIENKIFAGEQPEQLERYAAWLKSEYKGWKSILVFLTLNGREAWSSKDPDQYVRLAYVSQDEKRDLASWVDSCVETISGQEKLSVQTALEQYKELIIGLAKGDQAMSEAIVEKLKGRMECARLIYDNYWTAKISIEETFFTEIGACLDTGDWVAESWSGLDPYSSEGERGWGWRLKEAKTKKRRLWLRVFVENDCEVGLFLTDFCSAKTEKSFVKWCQENMARLKKDGWVLDDEKYPLYKSVLDCDGRIIYWNDDFYDRIAMDSKYREDVKAAIVRDLLLLRQELVKFIEAYP
jgi:hypothetical protein